jgi:serine/threonine-protein kinase
MVAPASAWKRLLPWALVTVLLMMFGGFLWTRGRDRSQTRPATRLDLVLPAEAPMASGGSLALSPDGRRLVYPAEVGGDWQLHLRHTETGETRSIPGTRGGDTPFFSPDGEWLGFFAGGKLRKVSLAGGEPVVLADAPIGLGGAWAPDDTIYFNTHEGEGLSRVPATGGQAQRVTQAQDWWPDILPGQEALLFIGHGAGRGFWNGIHSLRDGEVRRLLAPAYYARYVPTGHLVYAERGKLLAVAFDLAALVVTSEPVTLLEDLRTAGNFGGAPFALSQDGLLVYAPGQDIEFASLVWADHQGSVEPLGLEPGLFGESFSISPDGTQVAVPIREGSGSDIWLYDIARGTRTRFTFGLRDDPRARSQTPRWTPDGRHIVYTSLVFSSPEDEGPRAHLFWKPADGNREAVRLTPDDAPRQLGPDSFSPDGSVLTFFSNSPGTGFDLGLLRLDGIDPYAGKLPKAEFLLQTRYGEAWARFSPDGRWIAYMSNESGRYEVYVRPFPGPGPRVQISTDGGAEALWHPSGRQLFYRTFGTRFYVVDVRLSPEFEAGRPRLLFEGPFIHIPGYCVDISPDGERFLTLHNPQNFEPNPTLTVITNFFDELRRLVPADN